jgi:DNA-binding SARP family transcriptional activator/tetratricopeptide (TPR) repeat protein
MTPGEERAGRYGLELLGGFSLTDASGTAVSLTARKDKFLLAVLALGNGRPMPREGLYTVLWGDRGEEQARGSLRQSIATLHAVFKPGGFDPIVSTRDAISLDLQRICIDVAEFEAAAKAGSKRREALLLYRGQLLAGIDAPSPLAEDWLRRERDRLERLAMTIAEQVSEDRPGDADAEALAVADQVFGRDPMNETASRTLMRLHWRNGEKSQALRIYKACREALAKELQVSPGIETEQLYRDIVAGNTKATPVAAAPDVPSRTPALAVMPFDIISGNPALAPFAEGLAEELITGLGRFRFLDIIDRNSSAAISRISSDAAEIGAKLGVDMVVQGSLQRLGDQMRITVRLVQAATRKQLWSEALEFAAEDLPSMPDRIARLIVARLNQRVEQSLLEQSRHKPSLAAYECLLNGIKHIRGYGPDDNRLAVENFEKAVALDPDYGLARAYRGFADIVLHDYDNSPPHIKESALRLLHEGIALSPDNGRCRWLLGITLAYIGEHGAELRAYEHALELNPCDANVLCSYGIALTAHGRADEGIGCIREAMRLNPYHPEWYWIDLGISLYVARRYQEAVEAYSRKSNPLAFVKTRLAACYAQLGMLEEAGRLAADIKKNYPDFRVSAWRGSCWSQQEIQHFREGMLKAGLPE